MQTLFVSLQNIFTDFLDWDDRETVFRSVLRTDARFARAAGCDAVGGGARMGVGNVQNARRSAAWGHWQVIGARRGLRERPAGRVGSDRCAGLPGRSGVRFRAVGINQWSAVYRERAAGRGRFRGRRHRRESAAAAALLLRTKPAVWLAAAPVRCPDRPASPPCHRAPAG